MNVEFVLEKKIFLKDQNSLLKINKYFKLNYFIVLIGNESEAFSRLL